MVRYTAVVSFIAAAFLVACSPETTIPTPLQTQPTARTQAGETAMVATSDQGQTATDAQPAAPQQNSNAAQSAPRAQPPAPALDPSKGQEIGYVYEGFLSPHQEPGEEEETPSLTPEEFLAVGTPVARSQRPSHGHGVLRITNDLSRAYVDVQIEGINLDDLTMFHIHCGRPDELGPIIVDFALTGDVKSNFADGTFSVEITNEIIEQTSASGHGIVGAFTMGCEVPAGVAIDINPTDNKTKTIASLAYYGQQGELYFNLHTKAQQYFGEMRGQLRPVQP